MTSCRLFIATRGTKKNQANVQDIERAFFHIFFDNEINVYLVSNEKLKLEIINNVLIIAHIKYTWKIRFQSKNKSFTKMDQLQNG